MKISIGLSSFYNAKWIGIFYPTDIPRKDWFAYYCTRFDTYEINATFYRFPTLASLKSWYSKSPDGFAFSVKAPKVITHVKRFAETSEEIAKFYAVCREGLSEKLTNILFQLPPSFHYSEERLASIVGQLDVSFHNAVEFRHESWWRADVFDALASAGIAFCSVSYPKLPDDLIVSNGDVYLRMHGDLKLFASEYGKQKLIELAHKFQSAKCTTAFVYFNNTVSEGAIRDSLHFQELVRGL